MLNTPRKALSTRSSNLSTKDHSCVFCVDVFLDESFVNLAIYETKFQSFSDRVSRFQKTKTVKVAASLVGSLFD